MNYTLTVRCCFTESTSIRERKIYFSIYIRGGELNGQKQ